MPKLVDWVRRGVISKSETITSVTYWIVEAFGFMALKHSFKS